VTTSQSQMPLLDALLRWRYVLLVCIALLMFLGGVGRLTTDNDWQFFSWGGDILFGTHRAFVRSSGRISGAAPGGFHTYASYPFLQIGPPALLLGKALHRGPRDGLLLAGAMTQALGLCAVYCLDRAFRANDERMHRLQVLVGGSLTLTVWGSVTHFTHLDDALTLASLAAACWALTHGRFTTAGALLGLSAATKPWGVVLLILVLAAPSRRESLRAATAAVAVVVAVWGPFIAVDRTTLRLGDVNLPISPGSVLSVIGVGSLHRPEQLRLMQLGVGLLLATLITLRGGWPIAALGAFAWRLLLEPSAYAYYDAAVVVAAFMADLSLLRRRLPVLTLVTTALWMLTLVLPPGTEAALHLGEYTGLVIVAVLLPSYFHCRAATPVRSHV
jgi:hypothetical protein